MIAPGPGIPGKKVDSKMYSMDRPSTRAVDDRNKIRIHDKDARVEAKQHPMCANEDCFSRTASPFTLYCPICSDQEPDSAS